MYEELTIERSNFHMFKSISSIPSDEDKHIGWTYMMEQSPKIQKIFSGIIDLIKLYWFAPQVLYHVSVELINY